MLTGVTHLATVVPAAATLELSADGTTLRTNEEIRGWLLREAGLAAVQFQAFGAREETGWFRLSVGAVSPADIEGLLPRLRAALGTLR